MTITPLRCARISGSTARMPLKMPLTLTSTPCAQARGSAVASGAIGSMTPALLISASILPKASRARATAACTWLYSATSQVIASAWAPFLRSRVATRGDPLGRAREEQQRRALGRHRLGRGRADAPAGAGDDDRLSGKQCHRRLSRDLLVFPDERRSGRERQGGTAAGEGAMLSLGLNRATAGPGVARPGNTLGTPNSISGARVLSFGHVDCGDV